MNAKNRSYIGLAMAIASIPAPGKFGLILASMAIGWCLCNLLAPRD